jgi:hypothetical protein
VEVSEDSSQFQDGGVWDEYKIMQGRKDVQKRAQSELHPSCRQEPDGFASFASEL